MAIVTIILFAWGLQTLVAVMPTALVVFLARRRVHWNPWELLAFILPFLVWTLLMFSDWSAGRKSFSNLIEPAFLGIAIIIAAIVRASFGLRFLRCDCLGIDDWLMPYRRGHFFSFRLWPE